MSTEYDGDKFFTVENGVRTATPLLLALAVVELSDVVFAVDSVPAVRISRPSWLAMWPCAGSRVSNGSGVPGSVSAAVALLQVFGVTKDPFIVYSSNLFAILSLRWGLLSRLFMNIILTCDLLLDHQPQQVLGVLATVMLLCTGRYIHLSPASCLSCASSTRQWRSSWALLVG